MHDQPPNQERRSGQVDSSNTEWTILELLLDEQRPWATAEVAREFGDEVAVVDAIANLQAACLVHRTSDGFVFVTRAAAHFHKIME